MEAAKGNIRPRESLLNPKLWRPNALDSAARDPTLVWLDKNENLDSVLLDVSRNVLHDLPTLVLATYPEAGEIYRKLAHWVGVEPQSLLLTPGSDGAIRLVFEAFVEQGDAVVHTNPTFAMYAVYSQMFGADVHCIDYLPTEDGPYIDLERLIDAVKRYKPKLFCLPNPDSPTGTIMEPDDLRSLLTVCEEKGTVFLLDEAYHPFSQWSAVPWTETSPNLIVARTFAKAWGGAGLRLGYTVGHPDTISLLHKMRPMYEVSTIAVAFMSKMLDQSSEMMQSVCRIRDGKIFFVNAMDSLGFKVLPTSGNFLHVAFGERSEAVHAALSNKVLYRSKFSHPCLEGYSRFTVAPKPVMEKVAGLINQAAGGV